MIDTVIELSGDVTLDDRGTHNYDQLYNKPKINDVEIIGEKSLDDLGIQPKGDYLTEEVDPLFSASPSAGITEEDIENWNNKSEFSGKYNDLEGLPFIPTNVSELNNDSGYINSIPSEYVTDTELQNTLKPYAKSEDVPDISGKQDTLISGTNLKTINSVSLLGSGNIVIKSGLTEVPVATENTVGGIKVGANLSIEPDGTLNAEVSGDLSTNYVDLYNKPKINGVTLNGNHTLSSLGIQPKGDYITEETDPLFSASPSANITNQDIDNWNSKSEFNGDYNDLSNKPTIPTKTSDLVNDSGFLTGDIDLDLSSKQDVLVSGENIKTINNQSILGSGNITIEGGGIAEIPVASADTLGGIKIGSNLTITEDGVLSAEAGIAELPVASEDTLGGVKIGNGLVISEDGTLNIEELIAHDTSAIVLSASENLTISNSTDWTPIAFNNTDVKIGSNISVDEEHTYGVKIGAGIEYVKVSMYLNLGAYVDNQVPLVQIHKNDVSLAQYGLTCQKSWGNDLLTPSNYIIPVQEGDNISLKAKGNNNDLMIRSHSLMIVEEYIMSTGGSGGSTTVDGGDDVPINTIVDFDGDVVPDGWIEVEDESPTATSPKSLISISGGGERTYTIENWVWTPIDFNEVMRSLGNGFEYDTNTYEIKALKDMTIKIDAQISYFGTATGELNVCIVKNKDRINNTIAYANQYETFTDHAGTLNIVGATTDVVTGDTIQILFSGLAGTYSINQRTILSHMTVEEVSNTVTTYLESELENYGSITVINSTDVAETSVYGWINAPMDTVRQQIGDRLTLMDNGVLIGPGISHVRVSGYGICTFKNANTTAYEYMVAIRKNEENVMFNRVAINTNTTLENHISTIPAMVVPVTEGDMIYLSTYTTSAKVARTVKNNCTLTVEVAGDVVNTEVIEYTGATNYSTEETVIGTYFDGKPIYRRCYRHQFNGTYDDTKASGQMVSFIKDATGTTVDSIVRLDARGTNPKWDRIVFLGNSVISSYGSIEYRTFNGTNNIDWIQIGLIKDNPMYTETITLNDSVIDIIFEYTKATD